MSHTVNLEIEAEVLTSGGLAEIVTAILELLLYQRNQIDLVYSTFRNFVNKWLTAKQQQLTSATTKSDSLHGYMLDREREKAIKTKESISAMRQLIADAFDEHDIKSLRFLFGSTSATAKESYTLHLPTISSFCAHFDEHHRLSKSHLNQLLISLVTHKDLNLVFSKHLMPTNIFLEFELLQFTHNPTTSETLLAKMFPNAEKNQLPKSCKDIHFYLQHKKPANFENNKLNCCRKLKVFDSEHLEDKRCSITLLENALKNPSTWWESEITVKGFKGKLIKGHSIWNN